MPEGSVSVAEAVKAGVTMEIADKASATALTARVTTSETAIAVHKTALDAAVVDLTALLALATALQAALTDAGVTDIATLKTAVAGVTLPTITAVAP